MAKTDHTTSKAAPPSADRPTLREPVRLSAKTVKALDEAARTATPYRRTKRASA